jgi:4-amino-4-deoxy-L-arabinose transferase-like glycosyltransferase
MGAVARRLQLALVVTVAMIHAGFFIEVQRAEWSNERVFSDQQEYEQLARNLVTTGRYTSVPAGTPAIPAFERTPGYPLFLAAIYMVAGPQRLFVVVVHAVLFALLCVLVYLMAERMAGSSLALTAGLATALYPPLPYWGAFALSELLATFLLGAAIYLIIEGLEGRQVVRFSIAGAVLGYLALVRPAWVLFPLMLAAVLLVVSRVGRLGRHERGRVRGVAVAGLVAAALVVVSPWIAHVYVTFGKFSMNPVGMWKAVWWGYGQAMWPARVAVQLAELSKSEITGAALHARLDGLDIDVARARRWIEADREIRASWRAQGTLHEQMTAKLEVEPRYRAHAIAAIRAAPWAYATGRLLYGSFVLWAADIPVRYTRIDALPRGAIRAMYALQIAVLAAAVAGLAVLARHVPLAAAVFAAALLYVEGIHVPLHTDVRYSLPAKPLVVLLACAAVLHAYRWHAARRRLTGVASLRGLEDA